MTPGHAVCRRDVNPVRSDGAGGGLHVYAAAVIHRPAVLPAARVWHVGTALVVGAALLLQLVLVSVNGQLAMPERLLRLLSTYAFQANVLALVSCGLLALRPERDSTAWRVVRVNVLVAMVLTFAVYLLLLRPTLHLTGWDAVADVGLHYLSPALVVGGWVLFGPRRGIDAKVVLLALVWPVGWFAWTLLHGILSGFYPYPFVDVRSLGYGGVALRAGMVIVLLLGFTMVVWTLDRRLSTVAPHGWTPPWERTADTPRLSP
jgi:hypothetical protein